MYPVAKAATPSMVTISLLSCRIRLMCPSRPLNIPSVTLTLSRVEPRIVLAKVLQTRILHGAKLDEPIHLLLGDDDRSSIALVVVRRGAAGSFRRIISRSEAVVLAKTSALISGSWT